MVQISRELSRPLSSFRQFHPTKEFLCVPTGETSARRPENLLGWHNCWNLACPARVADTSAEDVLDVDEANIMKERTNQSCAKTTVNSRASRTKGHCGHGDGTLILARISGGPDGQRWVELKREGGTDLLFFL